MAKISDLSGAAREQRIAELKKKMQEAAAKAQAATDSGEAATPAPVASPTPAAAPVAQAAPAPTATAEKPAVAAPVRETGGNGSVAPKKAPAPQAAPKPTPKPKPAVEPEAAAPTPDEMNRREFLTYAWGAALGLLGVESGVGTFFFLYPRFKAGEFGGKFDIGPESILPDKTAAPEPFTAGKFWLIRTADDSPKALYMVCPHLGCLYKWVESNSRFECPCHGSKYTHDGYYIEGPAPRSLDSFNIAIENGDVVVDTGAKTLGAPASESPARAAV